MTREEKDNIDRLIDIFLTDLESLTHSAGWHQEGILSRMITFKGDLPPPTGYDQSNLTMLREIEFLRRPHALLPMIRSAIGLLSKQDKEKALAILANRFYQGDYLDPQTKTVKTFKDSTRAYMTGMDPKRYRKKLAEAYPALHGIVETLRIGMRLAG